MHFDFRKVEDLMPQGMGIFTTEPFPATSTGDRLENMYGLAIRCRDQLSKMLQMPWLAPTFLLRTWLGRFRFVRAWL
jgi:hypothetical protein